jgi:BRCT domain type II-containing protein
VLLLLAKKQSPRAGKSEIQISKSETSTKVRNSKRSTARTAHFDFELRICFGLSNCRPAASVRDSRFEFPHAFSERADLLHAPVRPL